MLNAKGSFRSLLQLLARECPSVPFRNSSVCCLSTSPAMNLQVKFRRKLALGHCSSSSHQSHPVHWGKDILSGVSGNLP